MTTMTLREMQNIENVHVKIRKEMKSRFPRVCVYCGSSKKVESANIRGHEYSEDINDYQYLCRKCHQKFDRENNIRFVLSAVSIFNQLTTNEGNTENAGYTPVKRRERE